MQFWMALFLLSQPAQAKDPGIAINADYVWGRQYHKEAVNPVVITVDNPGPAITGDLILRWGLSALVQKHKVVTMMDLEGATGPVWQIPVTLPEKTRRRYFAYVPGMPGESYSLWVFLRSGSREVKSFCVTGLPFRPGYAVVTQVGATSLFGLRAADAETGAGRPEELPDRLHGFDGIHAVVWTNADAATVSDPAQIEALRLWIATGGHFVIARTDTAGLAGTFLEAFAPVRFRGIAKMDDWSALRSFSGGTNAPSGESSVLDVKPRDAQVLLSAGGRPLIVRKLIGKGMVTFLAFDPSGAPFKEWEGVDLFWKKLLRLPPPATDPALNSRSLRQELGNINLFYNVSMHPGIPLPSLGWAFLMICLYVTVVGPLDYFGLRMIRKMPLTWVTFPVCVAVFSAIMLLSGPSRMSPRPTARETVVVDCIPEADVSRGWSIYTMLSPDKLRTSLVSDRAGTRLTAESALWTREESPCRIEEGRVEDWTFEKGATGVAVARWSGKGVPLSAQMASGSIRITNNTGIALPEALFIHRRQACRLSDIPTGISTHLLNPASGGWREGLRMLQEGRPLHDPYRTDLENLVFNMRAAIVSCSFGLDKAGDGSQGSLSGVAREIQAASWLEEGHGLLLAWAEAPGILRLTTEPPKLHTQTLFRVFLRDE